MIIWLVGRTNVGKSTIFNRLLWTFRAIVTDIAGTTRELLREEVTWSWQKVILVDSPWLERFSEEKEFIQQIIDESDVILFVVDGKVELGEQDIVIRDMILQSEKKKHVILLVNKLDGKVYGEDVQVLLADYYALGFETLIPLSAKEEEGMRFVAEAIHIKSQKLTAESTKQDWAIKLEIGKESHQQDTQTLSLAIVWRPNVGKSTLLNTLVGEEIAWVQDKPWTTLDYITAEFLYKGKKICLYDTAGVRKRGKTVGLEKIAYAKTVKMIEWVKPVVVLLVDLEEGLTHRDKSLIGEMVRLGIGIVVAVNKIDIFTPDIVDKSLKKIRHNLWFDRIPLLQISWKNTLWLSKLLESILRVHHDYKRRVATAKLNKVLNEAWIQSPPRFPKNKICKRKYITQVDEKPPTFVLSVNNKAYANFSFIGRIEKVLRKNFGFQWVPLVMKFVSKVEKNPYLIKKE